ncbi:MAG: DUF4349 domain-containing protein [Chloroflexi bacterium]|nr:DUF4349 domain-containing protein [Chloroflexota bacterium]
MKRPTLALLVTPAILLAACAAAGAPTLSAPDKGGVTFGINNEGPMGPAGSTVSAAAPVPAATGAPFRGDQSTQSGQGSIPVAQVFDPDRALILTASVALRAKEPWTVSDKVQAIATGLGGDVMSLAQSGSGEQRNAMLTIRVPQERFNDALRQIRDIGDIEVISSNVDGKDVTDQFIDLKARLSAKQTEESRYTALLARANTIDEILKIDQALSNVRLQVEQLTAQINTIKARTTFSTIVVQVAPATVVQPTPDPKAYDPAKTAERAFAALASMFRGAVDVAIWVLVFGWIPLVIFGLALLVSRTRTRLLPTA